MTKDQASAALAHYAQAYDFAGQHLVGTEKIFLHRADPQNCRYCRRTAPVARFRNVAHAIPHFLGNRILIACDECDDCNRLFGRTLEDSFSKATNFQRVITRTPGKKGLPTYKSKDKKTRWENGPAGARIFIGPDDQTTIVDPAKAEFTFEAQAQSYVPRLAYKCLLKMALAVMPAEDLEYFPAALDWLRADPATDHRRVNCQVAHTFIGGPTGFPFLSYFLFRRKDPAALCFHYSYMICWGKYAYQIFLPFSTRDRHLKGNVTIRAFPTPFVDSDPPPKIRYDWFDWSSTDLKTDGKGSIVFKAAKVIETDLTNPP